MLISSYICLAKTFKLILDKTFQHRT